MWNSLHHLHVPCPRRRALDLLIAKRQPNLLRVFHPVKAGSYLLLLRLSSRWAWRNAKYSPLQEVWRWKKAQWHAYTRLKRLLASLKRLTCFQIATGQLISLNITFTSWDLLPTKGPVINSYYSWSLNRFDLLTSFMSVRNTYLVSWPASHPWVLGSLRQKVLVSIRSRSLCTKGFLANVTMPGRDLTSQGWYVFDKDRLVGSCKEIETMC